jgi:hypothetical protein
MIGVEVSEATNRARWDVFGCVAVLVVLVIVDWMAPMRRGIHFTDEGRSAAVRGEDEQL